MSASSRPRALGAAAALGAALLLAACSGSTTPSASGSSSAAPTSSSSASASEPAAPNGIEKKTAQEILDESVAAAQEQSSVRIQAISEGENAFDFDLTATKGQGGYGRITADGSTVEVVVTTDSIYLKSDQAFWEKSYGAEAAAQIGDKWVQQASTTGSFSDVASLTDLDQVVEGLLNPSGEISKGEVGESDGQPAVALLSESGTLWVATTGDPLPLAIEQEEGGGRATFTDWSAPFTVPVPPADQVVPESELPVPTLPPTASPTAS